MRVHSVDTYHDRLVEIIRDYAEADISPDWHMTIGDNDISHRILSAELSITEDSPTWSLTTEIFGRLDLKLTNAPVYVWVVFEEVEFPILDAKISLPTPSDNSEDFVTTLLAFTPGAKLDKISVGEPIEYVGETPEAVIYDAVSMNPLYDNMDVQVENFGSPIINRYGQDGFEDEATLRSVLEAVQEQVNCVYYDTPMGGFRCMRDPGYGEGSGVAWIYEADSAEVLEWNEPTFATIDEQYSRVVVRDLLPEGATGGVGPGNRYRIWAERPVQYFWMNHPPEAEQTYWIPFSQEDNAAQGDADGLAAQEARKLGAGGFAGEMIAAFNPLLEPMDVILIQDNTEDDTGRYRRIWRSVIIELTHAYGEAASTKIVHRCTLIAEEELPETVESETGISPEVVIGVPYGSDATGEFIDPNYIVGQQWYGTEIINGEVVDYLDPNLVGEDFIGEDENGDYIRI